MLIRVLALTLLFGCGDSVQLKNNSIANLDPLTDTNAKNYVKSGILVKGNPSTVQYQGKSYTVSKFSSKSAQDFLDKSPTGIQIRIEFTGGTSGNEIVIESIKKAL